MEVPVKPAFSNPAAPHDIGGEISSALRGALTGVGLSTAVLNILLIAGSVYMMLVYDLVIPGRSEATLAGLFALVLVAYAFQGALEVIRGRILTHMARSVDARLDAPVHRLVLALARRAPGQDSAQPVRDLDQIRGFLSGPGPTALFDLPWVIFFVAILFLLHPALGVTVLLGGLVLVGLTILTDRLTRASIAELMTLSRDRQQIVDTTRRHSETIFAMGMGGRVERRWLAANRAYLRTHVRLSGSTATLASVGKIFRLLLQSLVLTVGALLVIADQASGGVIFASSILSSRALAPIELAIANWRGFITARESWKRLRETIPTMGAAPGRALLPPPASTLAVEDLSLAAAGGNTPIVRHAWFAAEAGTAVAVLGPSGCGKSTLLRGIAGILPPLSGAVRLDGASLDQWPREMLGLHIGYLPQNAELIDGTVAQNIARFDPSARDQAVIDAATAAGVHELIQHLPDGYNSDVGADGRNLSAGQRQRIALARALYGNPFLLLLDEPNSNLDRDGEQALIAAVRNVKRRGAIVVVVAHRPSILDAIDRVLLMRDGRIEAYDEKQKLLPGEPNNREAAGVSLAAVE